VPRRGGFHLHSGRAGRSARSWPSSHRCRPHRKHPRGPVPHRVLGELYRICRDRPYLKSLRVYHALQQDNRAYNIGRFPKTSGRVQWECPSFVWDTRGRWCG
jgi:hypothetical protein